MAYTEIKERNNKKYYYRAKSIRDGKKFKKHRVYLGRDLPKEKLFLKENIADNKLNIKKKSPALNKIINKIKQVLKNNKIKKAGIFGSYAEGKQKKDSDIDILIEPPKGTGFGFVRIQFELEKKLKKKVDLVSYNGLSPYLKSKILNQEVRII
ncbi:nucleotidyltransferase domain-containing protein [Candidatus Pacearchaeota archaeon]|nr:nucleotidyltransferase domain-containing protein [Candidatus Pacearchaeota archaeon]